MLSYMDVLELQLTYVLIIEIRQIKTLSIRKCKM